MLLTSNGVLNDLIRRTLIKLLDKPVEESRIVAVVDAILPFPGENRRTLADLDHASRSHSGSSATARPLRACCELIQRQENLVRLKSTATRGGPDLVKDAVLN